MTKMLLTLAAAALLAAPSAAAPSREAPVAAREEVRIPFVNFGGVRSFHADDDDVVYLQDRSRRWYRAELIGNCLGLRWANRIGVDTRGSSTLDRFATLIVDDERCQLSSLTRSEKPERRASRKKRAKQG
jgi:predicted DNA-binding WGR domain protein